MSDPIKPVTYAIAYTVADCSRSDRTLALNPPGDWSPECDLLVLLNWCTTDGISVWSDFGGGNTTTVAVPASTAASSMASARIPALARSAAATATTRRTATTPTPSTTRPVIASRRCRRHE